MRKLFFITVICTALSASAFGAAYKINGSGKVTSPAGKVQQGSVVQKTPNLYNNYNSSNYVASKQVTKAQVCAIDIVMDYSGSMTNWISEAKKCMTQIISQLPSSTKVGFRVFGQNGGANPYNPVLGTIKSITKNAKGKYIIKAVNSYLGNTLGGCSATARINSLMSNNATGILLGMDSVNVGGSTPLTFALEQAANQDFAGLGMNEPKKIVLITDGGENCGGDPCAFARSLMQRRKDIHIDVVLVSSNSKELKCLADTTGGKFYTTNNLSEFSTVLNQSMNSAQTQSIQQVKPTAPKQNYEFLTD